VFRQSRKRGRCTPEPTCFVAELPLRGFRTCCSKRWLRLSLLAPTAEPAGGISRERRTDCCCRDAEATQLAAALSPAVGDPQRCGALGEEAGR